MNVIIFGAAGKTGRLVVDKALAAGDNVTVFVHDSAAFPAGVRVIMGDAKDASAVRNALTDQEAVIDTIGGKTPYKSTDLETSVARNIINAMKSENVRRLIVISMMGIGDSADNAPFWYEHMLMPTFLHGSTKDKTEMESAVNASGVEFIIARPPLLSDSPATGAIKQITGDTKGHKITRADLAQFIVDQLISDQYLNQAVVIANS